MTSRSAAARYARALFDVVVKEGGLEAADRELSGFAAVLSGNEQLHRVMVNPAIPPARKRALVEALFAKGGTPGRPLAKLLLLLAERDRIALLADIARAFHDRLLQHQGVVSAEVTTAVPLTDQHRAALQQGLASATGRQVTLTARVDPAIIGGAVTRIGSTLYDGSIVRQLERLREQLAQE